MPGKRGWCYLLFLVVTFLGFNLSLAVFEYRAAVAQEKQVKDERPIAFKGACIHTAAGAPISRGVLIVHKGKIIAVGPEDSTAVPNGAVIRDVSGKVIIPG